MRRGTNVQAQSRGGASQAGEECTFLSLHSQWHEGASWYHHRPPHWGLFLLGSDRLFTATAEPFCEGARRRLVEAIAGRPAMVADVGSDVQTLRIEHEITRSTLRPTRSLAPRRLHSVSQEASGTILGQVRLDSGLAAPARIVIRLESRELGIPAETASDTSGRFQFSALAPGEYVVTVNSREYQTTSQTVGVPSATSVPVELDVQPVNKTAGNSLPPGAEPRISVAQLSIPEKARREYSRGLELLNRKHEPAKSMTHFQRALQQYPQFAMAALFLGIAQLQVHGWGEAQSNLQRALQLDSHLTPAYLALGALFTEEGRYEQAEPLLSRALVLEPRSAMIHYELGRTYWGLSRWKDAQDQAQTALNLQPDLPEAHVLMGNILLREGQANTALSQFRDYIRLAPGGPMAAPAKQVIARIEQHSAAAARPR